MNTVDRLVSGLRFVVFTSGPAERFLKASGQMVNAMGVVLSTEESGFIKVNGLRVIRVDMVFELPFYLQPNTRELGPMGFKMVMDRKPMQIRALIRVNGCEE